MTVSGRKNLNGKTGVESTLDRECQLWRVCATLDKASQAWQTKARLGTTHNSKTRFLLISHASGSVLGSHIARCRTELPLGRSPPALLGSVPGFCEAVVEMSCFFVISE